ncbi:hypothetical protein N7582_003730 [Saccharomyces uvarum]|uniref:Uncharacterized protein n=1 Tax=Saccharomyces uvarum TaxID=230603 RepID=A0AA35J4B0_SACUV|nr:hypothetical protein N7582_003730 [Saccharomyces uvarum]CAI4046107.1 hypothetical protein SUVC_12G0890 [Saccharomyces uvarum]
MLEREQIMEYVQETPIIPRRVIQYSVPRQTIAKPSPRVETVIAANTLQDLDSSQHPVIHDSWQSKEYSTQKYSGRTNEQRLSFEEHQNEQRQNSIGLIKRVNTFFKKKSSSRKNSIKSTGGVKPDDEIQIEKQHESKVDTPQAQPALRNLPKKQEENTKRHGLFSFEETPPVEAPTQEYSNAKDLTSDTTSPGRTKSSYGSFVSLEPGEAKFAPSESSEAKFATLEPASFRKPIERQNLRPGEQRNDLATENLNVTSMKDQKRILQIEQNKLIIEIIHLENLLNNHKKGEPYVIKNKCEEKSSQKDNSTLTSAPCSTPSDTPSQTEGTFSSLHRRNSLGGGVIIGPEDAEFEKRDDPLRDKWNALQSLENVFESKFESVPKPTQGDESAAIKEGRFQIAKISNLCFQVEESIKRRQDLEAKLREKSHGTDTELLSLMMENKRRQKTSVIVQLLSDITKEKSKRFTAEEQNFVNQNEVKPLISDLSAKINRLNSILEMKNTCIRKLSNQ